MAQLNDTAAQINSKLAQFTAEGGIAIYMTNDTGAVSVKGMIVEPASAVSNGFKVATGDAYDPIGVVAEAGVADGAECLVTIAGRANVLLEDSTASTAGYWVRLSATQDGRADATNAAPPGGTVQALNIHAQETGHCLETKTAGTDVLASCIIHFN